MHALDHPVLWGHVAVVAGAEECGIARETGRVPEQGDEQLPVSYAAAVAVLGGSVAERARVGEDEESHRQRHSAERCGYGVEHPQGEVVSVDLVVDDVADALDEEQEAVGGEEGDEHARLPSLLALPLLQVGEVAAQPHQKEGDGGEGEECRHAKRDVPDPHLLPEGSLQPVTVSAQAADPAPWPRLSVRYRTEWYPNVERWHQQGHHDQEHLQPSPPGNALLGLRLVQVEVGCVALLVEQCQETVDEVGGHTGREEQLHCASVLVCHTNGHTQVHLECVQYVHVPQLPLYIYIYTLYARVCVCVCVWLTERLFSPPSKLSWPCGSQCHCWSSSAPGAC